MIVVVSDLHMGGSEAPFFNREGFNHFFDSFLKAKESEISHFIMLGDVVDLWWKSTAEVVQDSSEIMLELSKLDMKKYYLIGNHDFDFKNIYPSETEFEIIEGLSSAKSSAGKGIVYDSALKSGGRDFRFIHGHQISYWYALSFYETFCKAMCGRMDNKPVSDIWDVLLEQEETSQQIQTEIKNLSKANREKLEYYLAGPLEPGPEDELKSVLEEWKLMSMFQDITRILEILKDNEISMEVRREVEEITNVLGNRYKELSTDSEKSLLVTFFIIWRKILQTIDLISEEKIPLETNEDIILKVRRVAAMLTTGLRSKEVLIHGHSHRPYLSKIHMSADPGHWLGDAGAYLVIKDGKISLKNWNAK